jgi:hypothetical protein
MRLTYLVSRQSQKLCRPRDAALSHARDPFGAAGLEGASLICFNGV